VSAVLQVLINDLLDIIEFLSLKALQQNVIFNVLKNVGVYAT
jgi:hypothetical protein